MRNFPPELALVIVCVIGMFTWYFLDHCTRYIIARCRARRLARRIITSYDHPSWGIGHDEKIGFYAGPVCGLPDQRCIRTQLVAEEPWLVFVWEKHSMVVRDKRNRTDQAGDYLLAKLGTVNYLCPRQVYEIMRPVFAKAGYVAIQRNGADGLEREMVLPA